MHLCMHPVHPMQPYINLYIYEYMKLTIYKMYINYASMHPMHLKKGIIMPMVSY